MAELGKTPVRSTTPRPTSLLHPRFDTFISDLGASKHISTAPELWISRRFDPKTHWRAQLHVKTDLGSTTTATTVISS